MLALCWHSTPAYYAFFDAGILDSGLHLSSVHVRPSDGSLGRRDHASMVVEGFVFECVCVCLCV